MVPPEPDGQGMKPVRALIADDERLLRAQLRTRLQEAWPDLQVAGEAREGREAVEMVATLQPEVVFLDIRMPVLTGIEAAHEISRLEGPPCEIVFVTAYDQYAVDAFEQGAIDYLLKPADPERLARTVARIRQRLALRQDAALAPTVAPPSPWAAPDGPPAPAPLNDLASRLAGLEALLRRQPGAEARPTHLRWLQAAHGRLLKLVAVDDVLFFRSDEKYTRVQTAAAEWLIRTPLRELQDQLDETQFWQVHRGTIVNARAIERIERDDTGRLQIHLHAHPEVLQVSRSFSHLFRQM